MLKKDFFPLTHSNHQIKALLKNNPLSPNRINVISEINVIKFIIFYLFCYKSLLQLNCKFPSEIMKHFGIRG